MFSGIPDTYKKPNAVCNWFCYVPVSHIVLVVLLLLLWPSRHLSLSHSFFFPLGNPLGYRRFRDASVMSKWLSLLSFLFHLNQDIPDGSSLVLVTAAQQIIFCILRTVIFKTPYRWLWYTFTLRTFWSFKLPQGSSSLSWCSILPYFLFLVRNSFFQHKEVKIFCCKLDF